MDSRTLFKQQASLQRREIMAKPSIQKTVKVTDQCSRYKSNNFIITIYPVIVSFV